MEALLSSQTTAPSNTLPPDCMYDQFPKFLTEEATNRSLFDSLDGTTSAVASFAVKTLPDTYVYVKRQWYFYDGTIWEQIDAPNAFVADDLVCVYRKVLKFFPEHRQVQNVIHKLSNFDTRRAYIAAMESMLSEKFKNIAFDCHHNLTPFINGVYDSSICKFREHHKTDYITKVIGYEFPQRSDKDVRARLENFFERIMPNGNVRAFLILYLALHLEGMNRHHIIAFFTGSDEYAKGALQALMKHVFGGFDGELGAKFLTCKRPVSNLDCLKNKRIVFAGGFGKKRINGMTLKFLTGRIHVNESEECLPKFLTTLMCHRVPSLDNEHISRAIWRRVVIFDFSVVHRNLLELSYSNMKDSMQSRAAEMMLMLTEVHQKYAEEGRRLTIPPQVQRLVTDEQLAD